MLGNNNGDLLSKLGKKPAQSTEGSGNPEPRQQTEGSTGSNTSAAQSSAGEGGSSSTAIGVDTKSVDGGEPTSSSSSADAAGSSLNNNSADWSPENMMKEIKKLREENKTKRLKYDETVDKIKSDYEARMSSIEKQLQEAANAKKELDKIKADQEDKKRDLADRVAHREARIAELEAAIERSQKENEIKELSYKSKLESYEAEKAAEDKVYQQKVQEEIATVPEKFREFATLIVKGAGDSREALYELQAAKANKLFADKTVEVIHAVPGAKDGARATKESLDEAAKSAKAKMTSSQKIREALKDIKSGTPNNAFKL